MNIFITGASGFVGNAAAKHFVAAGHHVFAMSRSDASDAKIRAAGANPVRCDLDTISASHLAEVDLVIHCAAFVEQWGPPDAWFRFNVTGTQTMLDVARAAGVKRFIHIGTEAVLVHGQNIENADESYKLAPDSPYPYCATKAQAEMRVRGANVPGSFETIVLRPRFIWGPGDTTLLPAIREMADAGKWVWIGGGRARTSTTHIDNLVHAIDLTLTKGRGGEAYFILDDGTATMREMISGMALATGLTLPDRAIPAWMARTAAFVSEKAWRAFDLEGPPPLTRHAAAVMALTCTLNDTKARSELGYVPVVDRAAGLAALAKG